MATLAIRGHKIRGKEVIEILEMLGGVNKNSLYGSNSFLYFFIEKGEIWSCERVYFDDAIIFTLEEFLEKFPYKVGDKVKTSSSNDNCAGTIVSMRWDDKYNEVIYKVYNPIKNKNLWKNKS